MRILRSQINVTRNTVDANRIWWRIICNEMELHVVLWLRIICDVMLDPKLLLKIMIIIADDDATRLCIDVLTSVMRILGIYLQVLRSTDTSTHSCPQLLINTHMGVNTLPADFFTVFCHRQVYV